MDRTGELFDAIDLPHLRSIIVAWLKRYPAVTRVTLWRSIESGTKYVLVAETPPFPAEMVEKIDKRRKHRAPIIEEYERNKKEEESKHPRDRSPVPFPLIEYPYDLRFSDEEGELIDFYESTETDCSHLWEWLPEIYKEKLEQHRHEWMWINVEPGEELDDTWLMMDSGHVLYERDPASELTFDPDMFIHQLRVGFVSDESIYLHPVGGTGEEFNCQAMGFKKGSKTWQVLIAMLNDGEYHVGIFSKDGNHVKSRYYNRNRKLINDCSKKILAFLNQHYSLSLGEDTRIFENMLIKGTDRPGVYKPVFQIINPARQALEAVKNMSGEDLIRKYRECADRYNSERNEDERLRLLSEEIGPLIDSGRKRGLIDEKTITQLYHSLREPGADSEDALSDTFSLPYVDNRVSLKNRDDY